MWRSQSLFWARENPLLRDKHMFGDFSYSFCLYTQSYISSRVAKNQNTLIPPQILLRYKRIFVSTRFRTKQFESNIKIRYKSSVTVTMMRLLAVRYGTYEYMMAVRTTLFASLLFAWDWCPEWQVLPAKGWGTFSI